MKRKSILWLVLVSFIVNMVLPYGAQAQTASTANLFLSAGNGSLPVIKGLRIDPEDPLRINFIIDTGTQGTVSKDEAAKLINYFLAGLTIPAQDLWVNLSPYEHNRIVEPSAGATDLGKDMLRLDYVLKQMAASLTYPETELGKKYWQAINSELSPTPSLTKRGSEQSFNKVWIVPQTGKIYENKDVAVIVEAKMKAMVEADYLAAQNSQNSKFQIPNPKSSNDNVSALKVHILPVINKEVNEGKNFAQLRQVYNSLVLATWFKKKFEQSFYRHYINQKQIAGIETSDKTAKDKIWAQYVEAFKKGAYNYVKKETVGARHASPVMTGTKITRRAYFSGGIDDATLPAVVEGAAASAENVDAVAKDGPLVEVIGQGASVIALAAIPNFTGMDEAQALEAAVNTLAAVIRDRSYLAMEPKLITALGRYIIDMGPGAGKNFITSLLNRIFLLETETRKKGDTGAANTMCIFVRALNLQIITPKIGQTWYEINVQAAMVNSTWDVIVDRSIESSAREVGLSLAQAKALLAKAKEASDEASRLIAVKADPKEIKAADERMVMARATLALGYEPTGDLRAWILYAHRNIGVGLALDQLRQRADGTFSRKARVVHGVAHENLGDQQSFIDGAVYDKMKMAMTGMLSVKLTPAQEKLGKRLALYGALGSPDSGVMSFEEFCDYLRDGALSLLEQGKTTMTLDNIVLGLVMSSRNAAVSHEIIEEAIAEINRRTDGSVTIRVIGNGQYEVKRRKPVDGGLNMADLSKVVGVSPNSLPVDLPMVDGNFFAKYNLQIINMQPIKNFTKGPVTGTVKVPGTP